MERAGVDRAGFTSLDQDYCTSATGPGTEGVELFDVIVFFSSNCSPATSLKSFS